MRQTNAVVNTSIFLGVAREVDGNVAKASKLQCLVLVKPAKKDSSIYTQAHVYLHTCILSIFTMAQIAMLACFKAGWVAIIVTHINSGIGPKFKVRQLICRGLFC